METRSITLAHPDTFSHYGLFSGENVQSGRIANHKATLKLVFMSAGSKENPAGVRNAPMRSIWPVSRPFLTFLKVPLTSS